MKLIVCIPCGLLVLQASSSSCTGNGSPDVSSQRCYFGSKKVLGLGESVSITLEDLNGSSGHLHLSGDGATGFTCSSHEFTKDGQKVTTDLKDCLPKGVVLEGVQYCSDQDKIQVKVNDENIPFGLGKLIVDAPHVPCGEDLIQASPCTGSASPDVPRCYSGSKSVFGQGESVSVTIEDLTGSSGHLHLSGDGVVGFTCSSHEFTKNGQQVTTNLNDCLPDGVVLEGVQYCGDQDKLQVEVNVKNIPFGLGKLTVDAEHVACASSSSVQV